MRDADRPLTAEGAKSFRRAAKGLVKLIGAEEISHLVSSPLLRARQTADIVAGVLREEGVKMAVEVSDTLGVRAEARAFVKMLGGLRGATGVIAVGHEPTLSAWVGELCFGKAGRVQFKKGAVAAIELEHGKGELAWLMQPGMLRGA
jgi:phosphohistidine phosphatase